MLYKIISFILFFLKYIFNNKSSKTNNNGDDKIKLNPLIFNEILPLIIINQSFTRLIELSLISKSAFTSIQYYLTYKQDSINYYTDSKSILKYITKNQFGSFNKKETSNINNYKYRLIQYKDVENLFITKITTDFDELKPMLIGLCGCDKLKKVTVIDDYNQITSYRNLDDYDVSFFQFDKLYLYWDYHQSIPESYENEVDYQEASVTGLSYIKFSFDFLKPYKPKKLKITTADISTDFLNIAYLNNILIKASARLESVDFQYHDTPPSFFIQAIQTPTIKSLSVRFSSLYNSIIDDELDVNSPIELHKKSLIIKSDLKNNKTLKKLKFKHSIYPHYSTNSNPSELLNDLLGNIALNKLGLEWFTLTQPNSHQLLSPLLKLPNITTLYCNSSSAEQFLSHCLENPNIQTLNVINDDFANTMGTENIYQIFLKKNKTLKNLIFNASENKKIKIL
ncbi:hypothetical protein DICPUDRAFT_78156 [Dictyostelium purpureum]|uniref:F-box domain-containing protein n=1 Tax=Dictyostelium purpureum TaxID=5786 RepID=F0ZIQ3_DICPU|nr:uncharacterized protein DICPUDRAFT_78156 [Dictyostelium purpureum]EGC36176.1 hypothetical protein DICPUDRAFT_78156 [Dictyostelium purpureum]|eukprot:XP_003287309.1 hypothetical protein DICPUDRAFT_78156 [Dictyostelium purpureum]